MFKALKITFLIFLFGFISCEKNPGLGGTSTIDGIVTFQEVFNGEVTSEYPAQEERVYIIYGDSTNVYDDEMRTDFNGRFEFNNLTKGVYTIYSFSSCQLCPSGKEAIFRELEVSENNSSVNCPEIKLIK